jgi:hypothetical protein
MWYPATVVVVVDGRFDRAQYDADRTAAAFAARLKDAVDLGSVRDDLAGVVQQTFGTDPHLGMGQPLRLAQASSGGQRPAARVTIDRAGHGRPLSADASSDPYRRCQVRAAASPQ